MDALTVDGTLFRLLAAGICLPHGASAVGKALSPRRARGEFVRLGLPLPSLAVATTIAVQAGGTLLCVFGRGGAAAAGAFGLAGFTVAATLIAHRFWDAPGEARVAGRDAFVEHVALAFALALLGVGHLGAPA